LIKCWANWRRINGYAWAGVRRYQQVAIASAPARLRGCAAAWVVYFDSFDQAGGSINHYVARWQGAFSAGLCGISFARPYASARANRGMHIAVRPG